LNAIGIAIGILIGLLSGAVALVLLRTANTASIKNVSSLIGITSEILAIPTFWFGGPWVATDLFELVEIEKIINPYIVTLATTFVKIVIYPIGTWIIQLAKELGQGAN
jgi:hypothetical protein